MHERERDCNRLESAREAPLMLTGTYDAAGLTALADAASRGATPHDTYTS